MTKWNGMRTGGAILLGVALAGAFVQAQSGNPPARNGKPLDERIAERFQNLDKDRDQRLTREELGAELFEQLNVDGDAAVTLAEAQGEIRRRGLETILKGAQAIRDKRAGSATAVAAANPVTAAAPKADDAKAADAKPVEAAARPVSSDPPLRQGPRRLDPGDHGVGRMVADLNLTDINGKTFRLSDFSDRPAIVIAFTNTSCPLSRKYAPSLGELERQFAGQKVPFIYVNPTASDKLEKIRAVISDQRLAGPYVRDNDARVALAVGATHTTDVVVLDARRTIVYRGAVDDQYGFEYSLDAPKNEYLKLAINAAIHHRPLLVAATEAPGCPLDLPETAASTEITFHNRISRILQSRCQECHRDGGAAPFELLTYEDAAAQGAAIRQAVERGVMPPWFAARAERGQPSHWANDKSLSDREKADLLTWLKQGKPAGDPADAPLPRVFPEGWRIGPPDHVVQLPAPLPVKATGVMPYEDVIVETGLTEDKWVRSMEIRPTAPEVVHHVVVFLLPPEGDDGSADGGNDGFYVAYAPGHDPLVFPEGFGKKLPARSRLKFQMHFTPNGTATHDQTRLGFLFSDEPPAQLVHVSGIANPRLSIPPGADNHAVTATQTIQEDTTLLAFFPHMHLRGKSFKYEATFPDGRTQTLLDIPRYDFNWQLSYRLAEPLELPKGTTLNLTGWYDNSKTNPANPDPDRTVKWGPQTFDEMMIGYIEHYSRGSANAKLGALGDFRNLESTFKRLDRNQDGKLSDDEFPADWKERLLKTDSNGDQGVTLEEIQAAIRRRRR